MESAGPPPVSNPSFEPSKPPVAPKPLKEPTRKQLRRQEKRKQRLLDTQHVLYAKHFSNYRLPVVQSQKRLTLQESTITPEVTERRPPIFKQKSNKSPWARFRMVQCPCHKCSHMLDAQSWLSHYLEVHRHIPFVELKQPLSQHPLRTTCNVAHLIRDAPALLGVFGYQREGLNPQTCARNTFLPNEYRQYSQHGVLLLFACRTMNALPGCSKQAREVLVLWVATSLQGVSISLRGLVQVANSSRYYAKRFKARPLQAETQTCRDLIKNDSNCMLISLEDLANMVNVGRQGQEFSIQVHITSEKKQ
ncbi:uncharacterized protein LOC115622903 [Scaptodrosophila lebanonensis]|uniref:Uncharacterized protein LOC115622903 n=1 Tax=Drosophila lebanonensis TaxID=7225 RepID=A0A6J2T7H7_DROLE|nr:uncharacterized protein LOC115622903 [Scaptodrosophila lebanonensis]